MPRKNMFNKACQTAEHPVYFASRALNRAERKYSTTRKELLAVLWALKTFRPYLLGAPFVLRTDHNALVWLMNFKEPEGQVARWLETLAEYDCKIEQRSGKQHLNADALSRREESSPTGKDTAQPAALTSQIATGEDTAQLATLTSRFGRISTATSEDTAQPATLAGRPVPIATSGDTARSATHACSQLPRATGEDNAQPATFAGSSVAMATIGIPHVLRPPLEVLCRLQLTKHRWTR